MAAYTADCEQLTNLGTTLTKQIDVISQVMSTVDGALNATTWTGPARDQFAADWNGNFKQALGKLNDAFGLAGRGCVTRSEEVRRILGTGV